MKKLLVLAAVLSALGAAMAKPVVARATPPLVPGAPVAVPSLGGAYVSSSVLFEISQAPSASSARVAGPMFTGGSSAANFRYSGGYRAYGQTPASNSVQITLTSAYVAVTNNHMVAWEGIAGDVSTCGGNLCSWVQGGLGLGTSCYGNGSNGQQYSYLEINYFGANDPNGFCPTTPNGQGYLQIAGQITPGSTHTFVAYLCGNTSGCSYFDPCTGFSMPSSYRRGALSQDGCFETSNVYLDDPNANQRQIQAPLEDGQGNSHGDHGVATFRASTNTFSFSQSGGGGCGRIYSGNKSWDGCLNAN